MLKKGIKEFEVKHISDMRTLQQNNALHLYFTQLSNALNEKGFTANQIINEEIEMFWTPVIIKELWRKVQKSMFGKRSTTKLKKIDEIGKIYDVFNKLISERTDGEVCIAFPSIENLCL